MRNHDAGCTLSPKPFTRWVAHVNSRFHPLKKDRCRYWSMVGRKAPENWRALSSVKKQVVPPRRLVVMASGESGERREAVSHPDCGTGRQATVCRVLRHAYRNRYVYDSSFGVPCNTSGVAYSWVLSTVTTGVVWSHRAQRSHALTRRQSAPQAHNYGRISRVRATSRCRHLLHLWADTATTRAARITRPTSRSAEQSVLTK